ncbi:MAG: hypothetical protein L0H63_15650, partial [Nitrococcus sp.]|nr:hypothetical protein [Nitrococcus sp.]
MFARKIEARAQEHVIFLEGDGHGRNIRGGIPRVRSVVFEEVPAGDLFLADVVVPAAEGRLAGMHTIDTIALSARLGWMPSYPQFDANPLDIADAAQAAGE